MVNTVRDRPQLPTAADFARLRANPVVAAFIAQTAAASPAPHPVNQAP
jgi:hypothetical protein